jgi:hypothetical protein
MGGPRGCAPAGLRAPRFESRAARHSLWPKSRPPLPVFGPVERVLETTFLGESHSLVVHELWVLVVAGSNPASPTKYCFFSNVWVSHRLARSRWNA